MTFTPSRISNSLIASASSFDTSNFVGPAGSFNDDGSQPAFTNVMSTAFTFESPSDAFDPDDPHAESATAATSVETPTAVRAPTGRLSAERFFRGEAPVPPARRGRGGLRTNNDIGIRYTR